MANKNNGWVGFDLDGTIAKYNGWIHETHIGEPVPAMVKKVQEYLTAGVEVRIFTARVAESDSNLDGSVHRVFAVRTAIESWCEKHIGQKLAVTNKKDFSMICLYDDRAFQVEANTGKIVGEPSAIDDAIEIVCNAMCQVLKTEPSQIIGSRKLYSIFHYLCDCKYGSLL